MIIGLPKSKIQFSRVSHSHRSKWNFGLFSDDAFSLETIFLSKYFIISISIIFCGEQKCNRQYYSASHWPQLCVVQLTWIMQFIWQCQPLWNCFERFKLTWKEKTQCLSSILCCRFLYCKLLGIIHFYPLWSPNRRSRTTGRSSRLSL